MKRYFNSDEAMDKFIHNYLAPLNKKFEVDRKNGIMTINWKDSKGIDRTGYFRKKTEHPEYLWIFNSVKVEAKKFIETHGLGNIEKNDYKSQWKNYEMIRSLKEDDGFLCTDIKHAYWQIGKKEGYISEKTYNKVVSIEDPAMKVIRNKALSCMTSPNIHESWENGKIVEKTEQRDVELRILYKDIRVKTFRTMRQIIDVIGEQYVYMYKIDGLFYKREAKEKVEQYLNSTNFLYRTQDAFYLGENIYCIEDEDGDGGKIRRF